MRKQLKHVIALGLVLGLSVSSSLVAFAGEWKQDIFGWHYQKDDGTLAGFEWLEIDDKWYLFEDGIMQYDTLSSDGYTLGSDGAWDQSIPKKSDEEVTKYFLTELYLSGIYNDTELSKWAIIYCEGDEAKARAVLADIKANNTPATSDADFRS